MKRFAIIGLSSFGYYLSRYFSEYDTEVLSIDNDESKVDKVKEYVKKAVVADAKDKEALKNLGVDEMDAAVVTLGDDINSSILVTLYLKEMGVKEIIAKAVNEDHAKILNLIGATRIIFPERDMAKRVAHTLRKTSLLDYVYLSEGFSMIELAPPASWNGKTLAELKIRNKYNAQVIMIKEIIPENLVMVPGPNHIIKESDILVMVGPEQDLEKLEKL